MIARSFTSHDTLYLVPSGRSEWLEGDSRTDSYRHSPTGYIRLWLALFSIGSISQEFGDCWRKHDHRPAGPLRVLRGGPRPTA